MPNNINKNYLLIFLFCIYSIFELIDLVAKFSIVGPLGPFVVGLNFVFLSIYSYSGGKYAKVISIYMALSIFCYTLLLFSYIVYIGAEAVSAEEALLYSSNLPRIRIFICVKLLLLLLIYLLIRRLKSNK